MAQLDKTFPTNDCAMCTISPKLVETGRHPNIEILTETRVLDVIGESGDFTVTVQREPRYVDVNKCIACGECVKVCPVILPDRFNEGLAPRHAAFKLYPRRCRTPSPSRSAASLPAGMPVGRPARQGYIALIREGRWDDAIRVIKMDNPSRDLRAHLQPSLRDSLQPRQVDEPVNIRASSALLPTKFTPIPASLTSQ